MKRLIIAAVLSTAFLTGCCFPIRVADDYAVKAPATWIRAEIVCGLNKPSGGVVTEAEWQSFVDEEVTPRFPDGLTVIAGAGQWKGASGKVERESSRVIVIVYEDAKDGKETASEKNIRQVAAAYGKRFGQEAVLLITSRSKVEFIPGTAGK
jgi:hypothetical protein